MNERNENLMSEVPSYSAFAGPLL